MPALVANIHVLAMKQGVAGTNPTMTGLALEFQKLLLSKPSQKLAHVRIDPLARRLEGTRQVIDDGRIGRLAGAALEDLHRDRVGLEDALRREQHPAALRLAVRQADATRQPGLRVRRYRGTVSHPASLNRHVRS